MKERGILFSAPMVRALLAGTKTQTRRAVKWRGLKPVPPDVEQHVGKLCIGWQLDDGNVPWTDFSETTVCPYGEPGDRLWVRETHWWFVDEPDHETGYHPPKLTVEDVEYRADGDDGRKVWRPSIFMPRWASRITLEITEVRVERLQAISEADAAAEGCEPASACDHARRACADIGCPGRTYREGYAQLWEQINGAGSWAANPWVWAVSFRRIDR